MVLCIIVNYFQINMKDKLTQEMAHYMDKNNVMLRDLGEVITIHKKLSASSKQVILDYLKIVL